MTWICNAKVKTFVTFYHKRHLPIRNTYCISNSKSIRIWTQTVKIEGNKCKIVNYSKSPFKNETFLWLSNTLIEVGMTQVVQCPQALAILSLHHLSKRNCTIDFTFLFQSKKKEGGWIWVFIFSSNLTVVVAKKLEAIIRNVEYMIIILFAISALHEM